MLAVQRAFSTLACAAFPPHARAVDGPLGVRWRASLALVADSPSVPYQFPLDAPCTVLRAADAHSLGLLPNMFRACLTTGGSAIWMEAADERWEAAATLAHIAVSHHINHASLWQQASHPAIPPLLPFLPWQLLLTSPPSSCLPRPESLPSALRHAAPPSVANHFLLRRAQWVELEEMRGHKESALRLRALASSAGVRFTGDR